MITRAATNRIAAVGLLLAAVYLVLTALRVFKGRFGWMEYSVIGVAAALLFIAAFARLKQRGEVEQSVRASRASLLKHLWELRHHREW